MTPGRWPAGGGEMARLVREHDWASTPLGPIEGWPQSLKTAVEMVLAMPGPATILWGPEHVQLYNDAYVAVARDRHPGLLGLPAEEGWPDAYEGVIAPLLDAVRAGRPTELADYPVALRGPDGRLEERVFDTAFSPVRDESGGVAGALQTLVEVTDRKRAEAALRESEERQAFLLKLSDALRPLAEPEEIRLTAARVLGRHLGASRIAYAEDVGDGQHFDVTRNYVAGAAEAAGRFRYADFGADLLSELEAGRIRVQPDIGADGRLGAAEKEALAAVGVGASLNVPLVKDGRLVAFLGVNYPAAHDFRPAEIGLVSEVAERTWAAVERARAEAALRETEERNRLIVEGARDYAIFTLDSGGRIASWSPGAEVVFGWGADEAVGRSPEFTFTPEDREAGVPEEELATALRDGSAPDVRWHARKDGSRAFIEGRTMALRRPDGTPRGFLKIGQDLTERRRAEEALRESEERYRLAADAAGIGRWEFAPETGKLLGDAAFERHHGAPPGSGLGFEGHLGAVHPDDREEIRRRMAEALEGRDGYEIEYRVPLPDGSTRFVLSRGRFVRGGDAKPDRLVGVTLDVTEGRELRSERERAAARELTALAEAAERERISRELHDRVAHHMGVAHQSLELHAALKEAAPGRAEEKLALARETARLALDQTRALSAELKRLQEEELSKGIGAALRALPATMSDGVEVGVRSSGDESVVPKPVALQVYLAMREAVRNAIRHSGGSRVGVELDISDGEVVGLVEDDGRGFDPEAVGKASPSWGVGLRSMRERAEMLGGTLRLDAEPGKGTRVQIMVPLDGHRP